MYTYDNIGPSMIIQLQMTYHRSSVFLRSLNDRGKEDSGCWNIEMEQLSLRANRNNINTS